MIPNFAAATKEDQIARLEQLGRAALSDFAVSPTSISPLVHAENTTFHVVSPQGEFCLRISRPGYQSNANIRSEILFLADLSRQGFRVPRPWQPRVVTASAPGVPEPRDCVLFQWIQGEILRKKISVAQMGQIGEFTAQLHEFVETWPEPAGFDRQKVHTWLLDPGETMAIDQPSDMVREPDREYLAGVAQDSRAMAATLPKDVRWIGLIHSDLHAANVVFRDGEMHAIDFDDTGYGFFIYDFASTLAMKAGDADYSEYRDALLAGYARVRPLPAQTEELLPQFVRLRLASVANWVAGRADHPEFRQISPDYIEKLCFAAQQV